jgi:hypothetical protein
MLSGTRVVLWSEESRYQIERIDPLDDNNLLKRIGMLANEELELEESHVGNPLSDDERKRLTTIEAELDQCWDLLRQRRARRSAGQDPDFAALRSEEVVEKYLQ